jgi:hypothetical protein
LNESALVAVPAHLSLVNAGAADSDDDESSAGAELEVSSPASSPPESASSPQATRLSPRAAPMATVAVSRLNRLVAMVDRFTL